MYRILAPDPEQEDPAMMLASHKHKGSRNRNREKKKNTREKKRTSKKGRKISERFRITQLWDTVPNP
jgi:hypothetical protein